MLAEQEQDYSSATGVGNHPDEKDLSASRVWENSMDANHDQSKSSQVLLFDLNTNSFIEINSSTEENVNALEKKNAFLVQLAAKTDLDKEKLEDPSLYHYANFSDNVLATSVVINSTVFHAKEAEKHVIHIITDKLNFAAMGMWFLVNPPPKAIIQVESIDDIKWLNSSNFYPNLYKILFLDDDIVVQKDLTPLWSIDLQGMVNGAVETCKESFHRFDKYLNFSNRTISENFDHNACGWAFGMSIFDLKEWKKRNITGIYHHSQDLNEDRTLWKLGTLPPGLLSLFYKLTYPLNRGWHNFGLGHDPALNLTEIENAAVIHYNGNYKPRLDLAVLKYKYYWFRYLVYDNPYRGLGNTTE
ncbi:hypothetical protein CIPAW_05G092200 [Carya illinoinensis]|uniref:Hexosyltransferase n=1 Tax=Carya illinoinensis TaxID=32201 RepID=A0A8T1QG53_CARIL|nr:hypothetical protein CIPAW_05G092200 [Carya illinoinensis]